MTISKSAYTIPYFSIGFRVDLGVMATKGYSTFLRF